MKQYTYDLIMWTGDLASFVMKVNDQMDKRAQSNWQIKDITNLSNERGQVSCVITWEQDY